MDASASISKYCVYKRWNNKPSDHTLSTVDEFDRKRSRFFEDEHVLESYMLQLARVAVGLLLVTMVRQSLERTSVRLNP